MLQSQDREGLTKQRSGAMDRKTSRFIPYTTGVFWVAVSGTIMFFWQEPSGFMYWVRLVVAGLPLLFGLDSLRHAIFSSDERIARLKSGEG
jgi:hypothetical protein